MHDYFWKYGKTLILCFETGEQLYDETVLAEKNTNVAYYESGEDITAFCMQKIREAAPDRVYVEMNCMIPELKDRLPKELKVIARTDDGEVMAVEHENYNIVGLQFHPESILTPDGKLMLENWYESL